MYSDISDEDSSISAVNYCDTMNLSSDVLAVATSTAATSVELRHGGPSVDRHVGNTHLGTSSAITMPIVSSHIYSTAGGSFPGFSSTPGHLSHVAEWAPVHQWTAVPKTAATASTFAYGGVPPRAAAPPAHGLASSSLHPHVQAPCMDWDLLPGP